MHKEIHVIFILEKEQWHLESAATVCHSNNMVKTPGLRFDMEEVLLLPDNSCSLPEPLTYSVKLGIIPIVRNNLKIKYAAVVEQADTYV